MEGNQLVLDNLPDVFELEIFTTTSPSKNTKLMGLYLSNDSFFTQCEAEGFRRITYFLDRPDVMALYTVTLRADTAKFPVLLSNGNLVEQGELPEGRHFAKWVDPFKKPSYLFALVVIYSLVALASTIVLALLGFPNPLLWGVLMGLASFVPFVGPPVAIGLVALVALITYEDLMHMLAAPLILAAIHFIESQLITPVFVSRRCALNTVAVFAGVAFLGWMWGAVGAIVAVPLLILVSTVAAHLPSLRWLSVLLSEDRP
eukprot:gene58698-78308_t